MLLSVAGLTKDAQTVTPDGQSVAQLIEGVAIRPVTTQLDDRGSICEIYDPAWDAGGEPIVYVYQSTVRPGRVKGWVVHLEQDDRLFVSQGSAKVVLYDGRSGSRTQGMINELYFGQERRALLRIPRGVFHAVRNIGQGELLFINVPTRRYDHTDPDKYRLPVDTEEIPYQL